VNKLDNLIPFKKGFDARRYVGVGAPKKWATVQKEEQYTRDEVITTLQSLIVLPIEDLKEIAADEKDASGLESIIAKSLITDHSKGSTYRLDSILDRIYGKAIEKKEENINVNVTSLKVEVVMTNIPIARSERELDV
jgi:hypothetical protein